MRHLDLTLLEGYIIKKEMMKNILIFLAGIFLFGCTTLETYIKNVENEYTAVPLIQKSSLIFGETFIMENCSLDYKGNEFSTTGFFTTKETTIRKYNFLKDKTILWRIEIIKQENKIESSDGRSAIILDRKRYIHIIENNQLKKMYTIDMEKKSYLTYQDDLVGSININYYQSKNKNDLEHDWLYNTGFNISVNDTEYGILAFYPLSFYRKNTDNSIDHNTHDKIILCVLAAYASYLYN
jgi:hypothetical protein